MSEPSDLKRKAKERPLIVWIPIELHDAFRLKLFNQRRTAKAVVTKMLLAYTGYIAKEVTNGEPGTEPPSV